MNFFSCPPDDQANSHVTKNQARNKTAGDPITQHMAEAEVKAEHPVNDTQEKEPEGCTCDPGNGHDDSSHANEFPQFCRHAAGCYR